MPQKLYSFQKWSIVTLKESSWLISLNQCSTLYSICCWSLDSKLSVCLGILGYIVLSSLFLSLSYLILNPLLIKVGFRYFPSIKVKKKKIRNALSIFEPSLKLRMYKHLRESSFTIYLSSKWLNQFYHLFSFSADLATPLKARLFLSCIIKLLISATLSLPHPASQAPFLSTIILSLICL